MIDTGKLDKACGEGCKSFHYDFSPAEVKSLAKFFRYYQSELPEILTKFSYSVEQVVYSYLSIEEAEEFFS